MADRIPVLQAVDTLRRAGYDVEYTSGNAHMFVRRTVNSYPTTLALRHGTVSERSVNQLIRRTL